ncbi:hypothetical protein KUCAC02_017683, partial [Chaenocephalus aceratus]
ATDTRRNHRRSAKAGTGNQGCLGNLALSIKCGPSLSSHQSPDGDGDASGFRRGRGEEVKQEGTVGA